jgi:hypothetical protein
MMIVVSVRLNGPIDEAFDAMRTETINKRSGETPIRWH